MRALVTGASGFIGGHLTRTLADQGHDVIAVDIVPPAEYPGVVPVVGDIRDAALMAAASRSVDVVYHHAALASVPASFVDPAEYMSVNVEGSVTVFEQARLADVKRIVMASTSAIYGDDPTPLKHEGLTPAPRSPYAVSKLAMEQMADVYARNYGMSMVALRYFNVYGSGQPADGGYAAVIPAFFAAARANESMQIYGDGEQTRGFVHVSDVVRANQLATKVEHHDGVAVANISSDEVTSVNQVAIAISSALDVPLSVNYKPARVGDIVHSRADIRWARELLGFESTISFAAGVRAMIE